MLEYNAFLRDEKEQAARSCWNKFANVMSFLKANGIHGLVKKAIGRASLRKSQKSMSRKNSISSSLRATRKSDSGTNFS